MEIDFRVIFNIISVSIWVVGVLGNIVNLIIFNCKEMSKSPINLIFWWLSFGDLFELFAMVLCQFSCEWCSILDPSIRMNKQMLEYEEEIFSSLSLVASNYLLLLIHTITVALNIILAVSRFLVVRKPIHNKSLFDYRSTRRAVICAFIFSFISCAPVLYEIAVAHDKKQVRSYVWILSIGIVLRLGSLVVLVVSGAMCILAVIKSLHGRQRTLSSTQITETGRAMKQINILTITILSMFIISDIPMVADGMLACFQQFAILVNCSYSTFCYLIFSFQYRKTLKSLFLNNKCVSFINSKRKNSEAVAEQGNMLLSVENSTSLI